MIKLQEIKLSDVDNEYISWLNNPKINKYLETKEATKESCLAYVRGKIYSNNSGMFLIMYQNIYTLEYKIKKELF